VTKAHEFRKAGLGGSVAELRRLFWVWRGGGIRDTRENRESSEIPGAKHSWAGLITGAFG
jgi:hypothetical protein